MSEPQLALAFIALLTIAVLSIPLAVGTDKSRIRRHFASLGKEVNRIDSRHLAWGGYGRTCYRVHYHDSDGSVRQADCHTAPLGGVRITKDRAPR